MRCKLVLISLVYLFLGLTNTASGSDNCATAPTSSLAVNVKNKGAKGNGITNDTAAIQAAINQIAGPGGTVLVPDGTYMIDAIDSIQMKSDMTLRMSRGAVLKALPNKRANYSIINFTGASNINVIGGTLIGERDEHSGTSGEWGMGMLVRNATNIVIEDVTVKNAWGDGFYIDGASKNIKFCSVIADNNRRQGMSVISVDGMLVKNSIFKNTEGTAPQSGIDLEPDEDKDTINNVQILNSQFSGNKGYGIIFCAPRHSIIKNVTLDGNTISSNKVGGIGLVNTSGHKVIHNLVKDNQNYGVRLYGGAKGNTVTGNKLTGKNGISDEGGNTIFDNSFD
jgi:parallel beta-helix repeat protein